ncbi:E3 ubiquitin-protein ligase RNF220-like [Halichondria panicea]|uniref:E3 ubiquitin-protein ligase RNF220-like n=1 Tax=Halichondria panicea TaxID=6063 RepID=UPI00312B7324
MATEKRERSSEQHEKLRKVTKFTSSPIYCPICEVTLRPDTLATHYDQEVARIQAPILPPRQRKRSSTQVGGAPSKRKSEQPLSEKVQMALDSVRRKRFLFERPPDQPGPSHQTTTTSTCSVCGAQLSTDEETASFHVANCLAESGETNDDSEDGSYEEYTWCNVTRVRATSLLSPQARANIFNGTVMSSAGDTSMDIEVDVEEDDTATYGPAQFSETHVQNSILDHSTGGEDNEVVKSNSGTSTSVQCLICMGGYTEPLVSVLCWHVYCEKCWLQALKAQKLCPKCKRITCAGDLRRIFL